MHSQIILKDLKLGICWHTPLHVTFRRQRQAHLFECEASLVYIYSSRLIQVYKVVAWDWSQDLHGGKKKLSSTNCPLTSDLHSYTMA